MKLGKYIRDIYFLPTVIYHNGDGIYWSVEIAWLKWYVGISRSVNRKENEK